MTITAGTSAGDSCSKYRALANAMLLKLLYWLAVLAISLALVIGLILFLESRDQSSIEEAARALFTRA
jgi:cytochrome b subunit of formate dehydrogenase